MRNFVVLIGTLFMLAACGSPYSTKGVPGFDENGKPRSPYIKLGKPYTISGRTYYPEHDPNYTEEGKASWYGPGFHGSKTANGEVFNAYGLTAAHRTLPLPSIVKVTHSKTGRNAIVRVNDRGPFAHNRIIDLSRGAAEAIGMIGEGIATVKVEYLPAESTRYNELLAQGRNPNHIDIAREVLEPVQLARAMEAETADPNETRVERIDVVDSTPPPAAKKSKNPSLWDSLSPVSSAQAEDKKPVRAEEDVPIKTVRTDALPPMDAEEAEALPAKLPVASPYAVLKKPISAPTKATEQATQGPRYYVLLGAFTRPENIANIRTKFEGEAEVELNEIKAMGRTLTQVRLGPLFDAQKADALLEKAHGFAMPDAKIMIVK